MEDKILRLFLFNYSLKFAEIEKQLQIRSNKLTYHLKKLVRKGVLHKSEETYSLSDAYEYLIPYLSEKKHVLTVVLIHIGDTQHVYLVERKKRPFRGKLGLPGGRLLLGETVKQGCQRIMKEKFGLAVKYEKTMAVSLEHLKRGKEIIHSYFLVYVKARAKNVVLTTMKKKKQIISSDLLLMKHSFGKEVTITNIITKI